MFKNILEIPFDTSIWLLVLTAWVLVWKGLALWKAARENSRWWFVALMVINTLGILEILYIYVFSKPGFLTGKKENKSSAGEA